MEKELWVSESFWLLFFFLVYQSYGIIIRFSNILTQNTLGTTQAWKTQAKIVRMRPRSKGVYTCALGLGGEGGRGAFN